MTGAQREEREERWRRGVRDSYRGTWRHGEAQAGPLTVRTSDGAERVLAAYSKGEARSVRVPKADTASAPKDKDHEQFKAAVTVAQKLVAQQPAAPAPGTMPF